MGISYGALDNNSWHKKTTTRNSRLKSQKFLNSLQFLAKFALWFKCKKKGNREMSYMEKYSGKLVRSVNRGSVVIVRNRTESSLVRTFLNAKILWEFLLRTLDILNLRQCQSIINRLRESRIPLKSHGQKSINRGHNRKFKLHCFSIPIRMHF